jgi:charged multivesicular body protein 6
MGQRVCPPRPKQTENADQLQIDQTVLQLKVCRDNLSRCQQRQEIILRREKNEARELMRSGKEDKARMVLRQTKVRQKHMDNICGRLENLQFVIDHIETQQEELQYMEALRSGNDVMRNLNDLMPIEEIERLKEENDELQERVNEIQSILGKQLTPDEEVDLDAEYEQLRAEVAENEQPEADDEELEPDGRIPLPA